MNNNVLLKLRDVKKYYELPGVRPFSSKRILKAVDGINLDINFGETFGLVGESGCGKTTVGQMIAGFTSATSGNIYLNEKELWKKQHNNQGDIQVVFQDPFNTLNPRKKIGWILEEPLRVHKKGTKSEIREKVIHMLLKGGFEEKDFHKFPHQLSGGQRQRIGILAAFMLNPQLIVADEPVSALDVSVQANILNFMKELQKEHQISYLFISHDLSVINHMSDRVGVMYLGRLVEIANVDSLYRNPAHPYTQALISAIPGISDAHEEGNILKGDVPSAMEHPNGCAFHTRCPKCTDFCTQGLPPVLVEIEEGHFVACHLYSGGVK